jgi:hypothetical protein
MLGGVEMFLYQGAGARVPNEVWSAKAQRKVALEEPLRDAVWPLWTGHPPSYMGGFSRNLIAMAAPKWVAGLSPSWRFVQMIPLILFQALAIGSLMLVRARARNPGLRPACQGWAKKYSVILKNLF